MMFQIALVAIIIIEGIVLFFLFRHSTTQRRRAEQAEKQVIGVRKELAKLARLTRIQAENRKEAEDEKRNVEEIDDNGLVDHADSLFPTNPELPND